MKPSATSLFCSSCKKRKKLPFCEANKFRDAYEKSEESRAWRLLHNVVQILEKLVLRRKNDATANPSGRKAVKDVEDNESDEETCPPMIASNDCRNGCVINRRRYRKGIRELCYDSVLIILTFLSWKQIILLLCKERQRRRVR